MKQSLCHLAFKAIIVLSVIGFWQASHFAANNFSKSGLQNGFPSRSKKGTADIGFLHGPAQTKWSSCHVLPIAFTTFCFFQRKKKISLKKIHLNTMKIRENTFNLFLKIRSWSRNILGTVNSLFCYFSLWKIHHINLMILRLCSFLCLLRFWWQS